MRIRTVLWLTTHSTMPPLRRIAPLLSLVITALTALLSLRHTPAAGLVGAPQTYTVRTASLLGDASATDRVRGARIQPDGTLVLAVNLNSAQPGGLTPTLLNGASATTSGALLRLSADGKTVLSVTRLAEQLTDLSGDAAGNLYVAAWSDGVFKLDPAVQQVLWHATPGKALRLDAGAAGTVAALITATNDPDSSAPGAGQIEIFDTNGTTLGSLPGHHNTLDVCVHEPSHTAIAIGWRQASVSGVPVQIAFLRGSDFAGAQRWLAYDWSTTAGDPRFINTPENNMADTRGYRCAIGGDGRLYAAFEAAGGNHIFRYSPFDISAKITLAGGDQWQQFSNTKSEHKTVFGRYDAATGTLFTGQQFLTRLGPDKNNAGNTLRVHRGAIAADAAGRVYLGGESAWGLPLPPHPRFMPAPGQTTFNHLEADASAYLGGAYLAVFSADLRTRVFVTRLAEGGGTGALDVRVGNDGGSTILAGGFVSSGAITRTYTLDPVQTTPGGGQDAWFGLFAAPAVPQPTVPPGLDRRTFLPAVLR